ncbi:MAG: hypothetical protein HY874_06670 [Chloroflexi bacterium]|nr:hypothetical protein [Chloroflexota bacterium]
MKRSILLAAVALGATFAAAAVSISTAGASHSWGGYHWARTSNPFTLKLGDNVSSNWDAYLATTSTDWSASTVLDTTIVAGAAKPKNCRPSSGRVEVCNAAYGSNGWLGVAQIWISGGHITQGTVRLNDTYFKTAAYNTPAWRNLVMCQEVGHTLGLDHQDEAFDHPNLGTCMDYTRDPSTNQHPNQHDYDELALIYAHLDTTTTLSAAAAAKGSAGLDDPGQWGRAVRSGADGRSVLYERDLGAGQKVVTFVTWAD